MLVDLVISVVALILLIRVILMLHLVMVCGSSPLEMLLDLLLSVFALIMVMHILILLPIFMVCGPSSYSVRNVARTTHFCHIYDRGFADYNPAMYRHGVRPILYTSLEMLVVLLVSVAALVMVIQIPVVLLIVIVCGPSPLEMLLDLVISVIALVMVVRIILLPIVLVCGPDCIRRRIGIAPYPIIKLILPDNIALVDFIAIMFKHYQITCRSVKLIIMRNNKTLFGLEHIH